MRKINIRRIIYRVRRDFFTLNNAVIVIGIFISCGWVWGSLDVMQKNYNLQKQLDDKQRKLIIAQIESDNEQLKRRYYNTDEYKELAVREKLGLGLPGESVLILPPNTEAAKTTGSEGQASSNTADIPKSNFEQWMDFIFGENSQS